MPMTARAMLTSSALSGSPVTKERSSLSVTTVKRYR
jgi:hypothetical protein